MKKFLSIFASFSNWKTLLIFLVLYVMFPAYILKNAEIKMNALAGKEVGVIDLTFGFDPQKTLDMVAAYGDAGRKYYASVEMTADIAYPFTYAVFFAIVLTLLFRRTSLAWVAIIPFISMIFDYCENVCIVTLLNSYPALSMAWATACEIFKLIKWIAFGSIILLIIYGLILKLFSKKTKVNVRPQD